MTKDYHTFRQYHNYRTKYNNHKTDDKFNWSMIVNWLGGNISCIVSAYDIHL